MVEAHIVDLWPASAVVSKNSVILPGAQMVLSGSVVLVSSRGKFSLLLLLGTL